MLAYRRNGAVQQQSCGSAAFAFFLEDPEHLLREAVAKRARMDA
jgi:hypothetical protein